MIYKRFGNDFADFEFDPDPDFDKKEKQLVCVFFNRYHQKEPMMVMFEFIVAVALAFPNYSPDCGSDSEEKGSYVGF